MSGETWSPAPAAGATARMPLPPPYEAARREAARVGKEYGEFRADLDEDLYIMFETPGTGGVALWDRLSDDERRRHLAKIQTEYERLPKLPVATDLAMVAAIREGFASGAGIGYENARFQYRAAWVVCELAKAAILGKASVPRIATIGSAFTSRFSDCAARTAARVIVEATGVEVSSSSLVRSFGLPRTAIDGYKSAVAYALNWFDGVGIKLAPRSGGFFVGGTQGRYVLFMEGGASGGHVVYGEVTANGLSIVDNQLGASWTSVMSAQNKLGMQLTGAFRVESVAVP